MKNFYFIVFIFIYAFCLLPNCKVAAAAPAEIMFCESLTNKLEPVNPGAEFVGPAVSWVVNSAQPFGKPAITLSLYKDDDGTQALLGRREIEINPAWDNIGLKNMRFPGVGKYTISLTSSAGDQIAAGSVTIVSMKGDRPDRPEEQVGATLESLFKKYNPKNK